MINKSKNMIQEVMRPATESERQSIQKYIDSISHSVDSTTQNATNCEDAMDEVLSIYHASDLCFQELFSTLRFPNLTAGDIIEIYTTLSETIGGDEIYIHRSSGDIEKL